MNVHSLFWCDSGVVHEQVERAKVVSQALHQLHSGLRLGDIGLVVKDPLSPGGQLFNGLTDLACTSDATNCEVEAHF